MTWFRQTFRSLGNHNFRLYFTGHAVSITGTWIQRIGQAWLVLELTGSGTLLGVTAALQYVPTLVIGPWGGLLADRIDKRRLLLWTAAAGGASALLLGLLTATGLVELWMVLVLAFVLGATSALDHPARQSFVHEMVGPKLLTNAITLNGVVFNAAKAVGPAVAGVVIATIGIAWTFFANAGSYAVLAIALVLLRPHELQPAIPTERAAGQLREGLRHVRDTPALLAPLGLMTVAGTLAYEWVVTVPLLAIQGFGGDAQTFGLMFSAMGVGAVIGGLLVAGVLRPSVRSLLGIAGLFSALMVAVAISPSLRLAFVVLFALGGASVAFRSVAASLLQVQALAEMRGRVMALFTVAMAGTTPIGAPLMGWIGETAGARLAFGVGGVATALAALGAAWYLRAHQVTVRAQRVAPDRGESFTA